MSKEGRLNDETIARIRLAVDFESCQEAEAMLLCGWDYRSDSDIAVADAMKRYLLQNHPMIANKAVCQRMSRDTVGDAIFSRIYVDELFKDSAFDAIHVFTSNYHVRRTEKIFKYVFGGDQVVIVKGAYGFDADELLAQEDKSLEAFEKTFSRAFPGDIKSIYASLDKYHPFYNGSVFSKVCGFGEVVRQLSVSGHSA